MVCREVTSSAEGGLGASGRTCSLSLALSARIEDFSLRQQSVVEPGDLRGLLRWFQPRLESHDDVRHGLLGGHWLCIKAAQVELNLRSGVDVAYFPSHVVGHLGLARAALPADGRDGSALLVPQPPNKLPNLLFMPRKVRNRVGQLGRERFCRPRGGYPHRFGG